MSEVEDDRRVDRILAIVEENIRLRARIAELMAALEDCANDLEAWLRVNDGDMDLVIKARSALARAKEYRCTRERANI